MLTLLTAALIALPAASAASPSRTIDAAALAGTWKGTLVHDGDSTAIGFGFEPDTSGRLRVEYTLPSLHFDRVPLGAPKLVVQGDSVRIGPFRFAYDPHRDRLTGTMPAALFPAYDIRVTLRRGAPPTAPARPAPRASVEPRWIFDGGSPMWAGPAFAEGCVYVGTQAGTVFALDAGTGVKLWKFTAGGAVRSRPTRAGNADYVAADDGVLYQLASATGALVWKVPLVEKPVPRLRAGEPGSRFDRFASDVVVSGGALYVGTPDGRLVALAAADGHVLWEFRRWRVRVRVAGGRWRADLDGRRWGMVVGPAGGHGRPRVRRCQRPGGVSRAQHGGARGTGPGQR